MKVNKLISWILIYCLLIQIPLMDMGCMSFYSTEKDNNLANYQNYDNDILVKLKDSTEIKIPEGGIYFINKDKIDSSKAIADNSGHYQFYWMNNGKRFIFGLENDYNLSPDSISNFYIVMDKNKNEFRKIYDNDIKEIRLQKTNGVIIAALAVTSVTAIILISLIINPVTLGFKGSK